MRQIHFEMRQKPIHTLIQLPTHTFSHELILVYKEDSTPEVGNMECEEHFLIRQWHMWWLWPL